MHMKQFPVIDLTATGENITRLRREKGLTVREVCIRRRPAAAGAEQNGRCAV